MHTAPGEKLMRINALANADGVDLPIVSGKLYACQHLPIPFFLVTENLELLETNLQGETALDNLWLGITTNKIHFNSRKNDLYVKRIIERLQRTGSSEQDASNYSECFVLRCIDGVCRSYTISRESQHTSNLVVTILGDISNSQAKIETLSRAFALSRSESRIVTMMVTGLKPKEIAFEAKISLNTVRSHLRTLYAKMQVRDYSEALTLAVRLLV